MWHKKKKKGHTTLRSPWVLMSRPEPKEPDESDENETAEGESETPPPSGG